MSKQLDDGFYQKLHLEDKLIENPQLSLPCHHTCVSSYVSKHHVARQFKRKGCYERSSSEPLSRRSRSSITQEFEFKKHCFICGEVCLPKNPKNPKRWRTVIQCRTANLADGNSFKSTIMDKCDQLKYDIADKVRIRINGAPSDLHAADAQYHKDCYSRFMSGRNLHASDGIKCKQTNKQGQQTSPPNPLMHVLDNMNGYKTRIWCTVELFDLYHSYGGTLSCRIMVEKVCASFNDDVLLMQIDGCDSLLGFRDQLSKYIANTSPTLLSLISKLVSNGKVDRKSLSISQSIQQHIQMIPNTTVLGLGIKLHHRFGSKELITLLNEYGYICTYDEVRKFCKSVAAYRTEQGIQCQGLDANRGPVYGWFDNYDLNVFTPNGKRETHAMAVEFSQNNLDVVSDWIFAIRFPSWWIKYVTIVHHLRLLQTQSANIRRREGEGQCWTKRTVVKLKNTCPSSQTPVDWMWKIARHGGNWRHQCAQRDRYRRSNGILIHWQLTNRLPYTCEEEDPDNGEIEAGDQGWIQHNLRPANSVCKFADYKPTSVCVFEGHIPVWTFHSPICLVWRMQWHENRLQSHSCEWVSEWFSLTAFLRTADIEVHIVHTSRVIIAYTLKSLSSLT